MISTKFVIFFVIVIRFKTTTKLLYNFVVVRLDKIQKEITMHLQNHIMRSKQFVVDENLQLKS